MNETIKEYLEFLYGRDQAVETYDRLSSLMEDASRRIKEAGNAPAAESQPGGGLPLDERDSILITYGDQFKQEGEAPLSTLGRFLKKYLKGFVSGVHILPFSPYSSDDGFSVIDYRQVNPELGDWHDISRIGADFRLMFDLVLNHISAQSPWFKGFLLNEAKYRDYFLVVPEGTDLAGVFRPRALPLLTRFKTSSEAHGMKEQLVWTTFSADQIDLNYQNPDLLLTMIEILLFYVEVGAQFIRLDAIAYLWKEIGTSCIHLEQTHRVVRLFRAVLDVVAPWVIIITETNVPHEENISYFGNGYNEAQMVYQFSLPPLVLDAFSRGDASHLSEWASTLGELKGNITFFNFLASHDGIGLLPAHGILKDEELHGLAELVKNHGGFVSYKSTPSGDVPYELNISYFDAISQPGEEDETRIKKFLGSQAIMLAIAGVPGIYVHSLLGTPNFMEGVRQTGANRTINRQKLKLNEVEEELAEAGSIRRRVFKGFTGLLEVRSAHPAFHPFGEQKIIKTKGAVFALMRISPDKGERILCLFNTGSEPALFASPHSQLGIDKRYKLKDIISGRSVPGNKDSELAVDLKACQFLWLKMTRA